ncbi:MAG TPA: M20/M25/M40 family metallo-hydrolase [Bryobacteraceae bacterium]|nr:M20/M25/M40 family metallo-hydrolase [Bryobacteraceae bacterium]
MSFLRRGFLPGILLLSACFGQSLPLTPEVQSALDRVSAQSLRGNLSFLASDLLEGRDTPSRGLDLAAEYIAAQFRRAGLEPAGGDGYFQTAPFEVYEPRTDHFRLELAAGGQTVAVGAGEVRAQSPAAVDVKQAGVFLMHADTPEPQAGDVAGKVVILDAGKSGQLGGWMFRRMRALRAMQPAAVLLIDREGMYFQSEASNRLVDPEAAAPQAVLVVHSAPLARVLDDLPPGAAEAAVTLHLDEAVKKPVTLRNVIGVLRGSDPGLRDSCVLVTAHYDHIGVRTSGEGDRIYNGANDDGSGTVSVIELAHALAALPHRPKRSIVFLTFFGEEKGGFGARYYARHPVFPIEKTVADVNLEQLGRTDSTEGPQIATATFTGFEYSDLPEVFREAGKLTGVTVYKDEQNSDAFFSRSDNQMLANQGIPAHTVCVAFEYPDYHGVSDHWEKIDYDNMAKVDRMLALGVLMLADNPAPPHWDAKNSKVASYLKAWKERHAGD